MYKVGDRVVWNGHAATVIDVLRNACYDITPENHFGYMTVHESEISLLA